MWEVKKKISEREKQISHQNLQRSSSSSPREGKGWKMAVQKQWVQFKGTQ